MVVNLRNKSLQERHWDQIHSLIGFEIKSRPEITLGELIEKKVCHLTKKKKSVVGAVFPKTEEDKKSKVAFSFVSVCLDFLDFSRFFTIFFFLQQR